jgi:DNA-directed RNA polymerase subunit beta'
LRTGEAGYLTRRLVEASQNIIVTKSDCGTLNGILMTEDNLMPLTKRVHGRCLAQDVTNQEGEVIFPRNTIL